MENHSGVGRVCRAATLATVVLLVGCGNGGGTSTTDAAATDAASEIGSTDATITDATSSDSPTSPDAPSTDALSDDSASDVATDDSALDGSEAAPDAGADTVDAPDVLVPPDGAFTCTPAIVDDAAVGTRFCDLYTEIIAGPAPHKCQNARCHGGAGAIPFQIALGWDGTSAYNAMTTWNVGFLTPHALVKIVAGGDSRPVSCLLTVLTGDAGAPQMPFGGPPLTSDQISRVGQWLARGAPFD